MQNFNMMTIARSNYGVYFTILEVNSSTYDDIRGRLERIDMLWKYKSTDTDGVEVIVFGSTALKREKQ